MTSIVERYNRPLLFYGLSTVLPWSFWLAAARLSYAADQTAQVRWSESVLGAIGLLAPLFVAFALAARDKDLRADLWRRLFNVGSVRAAYWYIAFGLMPASILLAMAISTRLGYSPRQFQLAAHASFSSGVFPVWFLLIAAPIIEELGWHTYGTDCLRSRFNLFTASIIFAAYWAVWHAPLAAIKDYYQSNLVHAGMLVTLNFPISIIPFVLIMNWLYYKSGRNIAITAVFHITAGFFNELFSVHPDSKIIQTGLFLIVSAGLLFTEPKFFFSRSVAAIASRSAAAGTD